MKNNKQIMLTSYVLKQYEITYLPNIEAVVFANLMIGLRAFMENDYEIK